MRLKQACSSGAKVDKVRGCFNDMLQPAAGYCSSVKTTRPIQGEGHRLHATRAGRTRFPSGSKFEPSFPRPLFMSPSLGRF